MGNCIALLLSFVAICTAGCASDNRLVQPKEPLQVFVAELDLPTDRPHPPMYAGPLAGYTESDVRSVLGTPDLVGIDRYSFLDCVMNTVRGAEDRPEEELSSDPRDFTIRTFFYLDRDLAIRFERRSVCDVFHLNDMPDFEVYLARRRDDPTYRDSAFDWMMGKAK